MKLKLPLLLLGALWACWSLPAVAFVADGINVNKIDKSERFYDVGKGAYWWGYAFNPDNKPAIIQAMRTWSNPALSYSSGNYGFLGDLWDYIPTSPINYHDTETWGAGAFVNLNFDSYASGAAVSSTALQYWQGYYGIFFQGNQWEVPETLPMGYNYNKNYLYMLDSTQALRIYSYINRSVDEDGFLSYNPIYVYRKLDEDGEVVTTTTALGMWEVKGNQVGEIENSYLSYYFKEFFPDGSEPAVSEEVSWNDLERKLATGMGLVRNSNGSYEVETIGQLVGLRLESLETSDEELEFYGHALTCYGFEAQEDGNTLAIWVSDSDDHEYNLQKLYVKEVSGVLRLYTDSTCTTEYRSQDSTWSLTGISYINTPQVLKDLYAEYTGAETDLIWSGTHGELNKNGIWGRELAATYEELPTEETGWDVYVGEGSAFAGYYHTYYQEGRKVLFGDHADGSKYEGNITVSFPVSVSGMTVDNSSVDYTFTGTFKGNAITTPLLVKQGGGSAVLNSLYVNSETVRIESGSLTLGAWTELRGSHVTVGEDGELVLTRGASSSAVSGLFSLSGELQVDGTLSLLSSSRSAAEHVYGSETSTLSFLVTSSAISKPILALAGSMEWDGQVTVTLDSSIGNREADYLLVSTSDGMEMGSLYRYSMTYGNIDGTKYYSYLSLSGDQNDLLLSIRKGVSLFWKGGSGTWNMESDSKTWSRVPSGEEPWMSYQENTNVATFMGGNGAVQVTEDVKTQILNFEQCSYNFTGADHLNIANQLSVSAIRGSASVVMDVAPKMGSRSSVMIVGRQASLTINQGDWRVDSLYNEGQLTLVNGSLELVEVTRCGGSVSVGGDLTLKAASDYSFECLVVQGNVRYNQEKPGMLTVGSGSVMGCIQGGKLVVISGMTSLTGSGTTTLERLSGDGSLSVDCNLVLTGDSQLGGDLSVGGLLTLDGVTKLDVSGTLSSGKIHLTQFGEPLIRSGSLVGPVDFHLAEEDIYVLRDWGMSSGDQVVIVESDLVRGDLSVNGESKISVGAYDYALAVSSGQDVVLTATLSGEAMLWQGGKEAFASAPESWNTGRRPDVDDILALCGDGAGDVHVDELIRASELVLDSQEKGYTLIGNGGLELDRLTISCGELMISNQVEVAEKTLVGGKGTLVVESSLVTQALEVRPEGALVNKGQLTVQGALEASEIVLSGGTLTVGDGTRLGTLSLDEENTRGNLVVSHSNVSVDAPGNAVADLTIAPKAALSLGGDIVLWGALENSGQLTSTASVVLEQATTQGGSLKAVVLTLKGQQNQFSSLEVDRLVMAGNLSDTTPLVMVEGSLGAVSAGGAVTLELADTSVTSGSYMLIHASIANSSRYKLDLKTLHTFMSRGVSAEVLQSEENVCLVVGDSEPSIYGQFLSSTNGRAGGKLLDGVFVSAFPQENAAQYPDLACVMSALDEQLDAGHSGAADTLSAAVAGVSNAALGMAVVHDMQRQLRAIRNRTTSMGVASECVQSEEFPLYNAWINAEGHRFLLKDDGANAGYELNSWGGTVGLDVDVSPLLTWGVAISAMHGRFSSSAADYSHGDLDTEYLSLFARFCQQSWTHTFLFSIGWADSSVRRTVDYGSGSYTTRGGTDGLSFGLLYEAGYTVPMNVRASTCLQPLFQCSWVHSSLSGFTETGCDASLSVGEQTLDLVTVAAGARLQAAVGENIYNRTSLFECRVLLKADAGDRRSNAQVGMVSVPSGAPVTIQSAESGTWGVELGAGLMTPLGAQGGILFFDVSAEFRPDDRSVNGTVGYRINF